MSKADDFIEQQYILRLPPQLAEKVEKFIIEIPRQSIDNKQNMTEDTLSVEFDSDRHGILYLSYFDEVRQVFTHEQYECLVVDMPTVIESYISLDLDTYYKCGQVVKMILVTTEEFESKQRARMRHLIQGIDPIVKAPTTVQPANQAPLPPHIQQKQLSDQKRERELQEERELQLRRAEEERKKKELEQVIKENDLDVNVYHSGITPSLYNIYEHWEKIKVTVTKEEVERMVNNYYVWLFDEKDFKIEKIPEDGNVGVQNEVIDYEVGSEHSDEEMKGIAQEMSMEEDQGEYSDSNEYSMDSRSDMDMDDSSTDTHYENMKKIEELKRQRDSAIQNLNRANMEVKRLQKEINDIQNPLLRSDLESKMEEKMLYIDDIKDEIRGLKQQIEDLQQTF